MKFSDRVYAAIGALCVLVGGALVIILMLPYLGVVLFMVAFVLAAALGLSLLGTAIAFLWSLGEIIVEFFYGLGTLIRDSWNKLTG